MGVRITRGATVSKVTQSSQAPPARQAKFLVAGYRAAVLADAPLVYHPMDETAVANGQPAADRSGNGHAGSYAGNGNRGGIFCPVDGGESVGVWLRNPGTPNANYLTSGAIATFTTNYTLECWFRIKDNNSDQVLLQTTDSQIIFRLHNVSGGKSLQALINFTTVGTAAPVIDSIQWHHAVLTVGATSAATKFYLDGVDVTPSLTAATLQPSTATWQIGRGFDADGIVMAHAAVYNSVLSATRVAAHYEAAQLDYQPETVRYGLHQDTVYFPANRTSKNAVAAAVGAKICRCSLPWDVIQPASAASFDWSRIDNFVNDMVALGIEPLLVPVRSPQWASGFSDVQAVPTGAGLAPWISAYTTFIAAAVDRYKDRVSRWELWNEPNFGFSWNAGGSGSTSHSDFSAWYIAMQTAIKGVDPNAKCAANVTSMGGTGAGSIDGVTWLRDIIADGCNPDYISVHPYDDGAPYEHVSFAQNFDDLHKVIDTMYDLGIYAPRKLWITEWGWPTGGTGAVTQANQAIYIGQSLAMIRDVFSREVEIAILFWDADDPANNLQHGLYTSAFAPKPAAGVFRAHSLGYGV